MPLSAAELRWLHRGICALALVCAAVGCHSQSVIGPTFESANPGGHFTNLDAGVEPKAGSGGGVAYAVSLTEPSGADGERSLDNAPIVRFEGERLYAMSRHGGLAAFDTGEADQLRVLHSPRRNSEAALLQVPFQLYVRGSRILEVYSSRPSSKLEAESGQWLQLQARSLIRVLDASDAQALQPVQELEIAGTVFDTHLRDDVLYVAAVDDIGPSYATRLSSYDLAGDAVEQVDELLVRALPAYPRTIYAAEQRIYVPFRSGETSGSIVVVDTSDRAGFLALGATLQVAAGLRDRWQMNEYQGVFRVVSQVLGGSTPATWLETFAVTSAQAPSKLASFELMPDTPAALNQVRFDGTRVYVVMTGRYLGIALDLSDPQHPTQLGIFGGHSNIDLQVRNNRALSLDLSQFNNAAEGKLLLSARDLSQPGSPQPTASSLTLADHWSESEWRASREHAALEQSSAQGPLLVSLFGPGEAGDATVCQPKVSYVQWCDWDEAELSARGKAQVSGRAQAARLRGDRLFAFSDQSVASFDVSDPDRPQLTAAAPLGQHVDRLLVLEQGDVVRIGRDSLSGRSVLDVSPADTVELPGLARLVIPAGEDSCPPHLKLVAALAHARTVYLVYETEGSDDSTHSRVVSVDVSEPQAPRVVGDVTLPFVAEAVADSSRVLADSGAPIVAVGPALVFADRATQLSEDEPGHIEHALLHVVDFTDPSHPVTVNVTLPSWPAASQLLVDGSIVATSHYQVSSEDDKHARFYLDRVEVAKLNAPQLLPPLSIPGSLLFFDRAAQRALSVDYELIDATYSDQTSCYSAFRFPHFSKASEDASDGVCTATVQSLRLIDLAQQPASILHSVPLAATESIVASAATAERIFVYVATNGAWIDRGDCHNCSFVPYTRRQTELPKLLVLSSMRDKTWSSGTLLLSANDLEAPIPMWAHARQAVLWTGGWDDIAIVDGTHPSEPLQVAAYPTHPYLRVQQFGFAGDRFISALGSDGVTGL